MRRQGKAKAPGMQLRRLLGVEEVADLLGISPKTIYNQVGRKSKRQFPVKAKRVGRLVKFAVEDVENFIQKL
jgi:excisionase family DNA binding protein